MYFVFLCQNYYYSFEKGLKKYVYLADFDIFAILQSVHQATLYPKGIIK
jgi:hypothetical protein